jgi:hypothetical protein
MTKSTKNMMCFVRVVALQTGVSANKVGYPTSDVVIYKNM